MKAAPPRTITRIDYCLVSVAPVGSPSKLFGYGTELNERRLEIINDFLGDHQGQGDCQCLQGTRREAS